MFAKAKQKIPFSSPLRTFSFKTFLGPIVESGYESILNALSITSASRTIKINLLRQTVVATAYLKIAFSRHLRAFILRDPHNFNGEELDEFSWLAEHIQTRAPQMILATGPAVSKTAAAVDTCWPSTA